jgi:hypothetical protein
MSNTVQSVTTANATTYMGPTPALFGANIFGNLYNMCVTTPAATLNNGGFGGIFNTTNGLCGPLAVGTWNSAT